MNLIQFLLCAFIFILCKEWMFNYMSSACPPLSMCINLVGLKLALKRIRGTKVVRKVKAGSWDGGFMFHKILQGEMVGRQGVTSKQNEEGEGGRGKDTIKYPNLARWDGHRSNLSSCACNCSCSVLISSNLCARLETHCSTALHNLWLLYYFLVSFDVQWALEETI